MMIDLWGVFRNGLWILGLAVVLAGLAAMGLCVRNGYTGLDVREFILDSPYFTRVGVLKSFWLSISGRAFPESAYYPVFQISMGLDLYLFKLRPELSAMLNIGIHLVNALLVMKLARHFLERDAKLPFGPSLAAATVSAILFAVHPVNVEPVAWICGRKVLLAFFFGALSLMLAVKRTFRWRDIVLSAVCLLLSTCSNALSLGIPFVVAAYYVMVRRVSSRDLARRLIPLLIVLFVFGGLRSYHNREELVRFQNARHTADKIGDGLRGQAGQILSLVYPSNLSHIYGVPKPPYYTTGTYAGAAIILVAAALVLLLWRSRNPLSSALGFLLAAYWLSLSPTFLHHFARADRHLYVAGTALFMLAGVGFAVLISRFRSTAATVWMAGPLVLVFLVAPLTYASLKQTRLWRDNLTLFEYAVGLTPENPKALGNLAFYLMASGQFPRAKEYYYKGLQIRPRPEMYLNLGIIFESEQDVDKAIECYKKGLDMTPDDAKAHAYLAKALTKKGLREEALQHFQKDLELASHLSRPHVNMGVVMAGKNDMESAATFFAKALEIEPKSAKINYDFGVVLEKHGDREGAVRRYSRALEIDPDHVQAHNNLGVVLANSGKTDEAIERFEKTVELDPSLIRTQANLAALLHEKGRTRLAVAHYREVLKKAEETGDKDLADDVRATLASLSGNEGPTALSARDHYKLGVAAEQKGDDRDAEKHYLKAMELDPNHALTHSRLGTAYLKQKKYEKAVERLGKAVELDPALIRTQASLGIALALSGKSDEAVAEFRAALKRAKDSEEKELEKEVLSWLENLGAPVEINP